MIPVSGDNMVTFVQERNGPDRDGFLTGIEMQESAHPPEVVVLKRGLFKAPDPAEIAEKLDLVGLAKSTIDRGVGGSG